MSFPAVRLATTADAVRDCYPAYKEIRPQLRDADDLVDRWQSQRGDSYRIAYISGDAGVESAVGYRVIETAVWGKTLYIDDFTTLPAGRDKGHATALMWHVEAEARAAECDEIHRDPVHAKAG